MTNIKNITVRMAMNFGMASKKSFSATVEAEYGSKVVYGEKITMAHHVEEFRDNPAPCNVQDVPELDDGDEILVSHLDLDSIGGCLALMGIKPDMSPGFWDLAEFIDLNGPHHLKLADYPQQAKDELIALWAWNFKNRSPRRDFNQLHDVTDEVLRWGEFLSSMAEEDIEEGKKWLSATEKAVESCLVYEDENFRVFSSNGPFCNGSYYSHKMGKVIPSVITYSRKFGSITMSLANKEDKRNACSIMRSLFGPLAGGHKGIAGSPRGVVMERKEALRAASFILGSKAPRKKKNRLALRMRRGY